MKFIRFLLSLSLLAIAFGCGQAKVDPIPKSPTTVIAPAPKRLASPDTTKSKVVKVVRAILRAIPSSDTLWEKPVTIQYWDGTQKEIVGWKIRLRRARSDTTVFATTDHKVISVKPMWESDGGWKPQINSVRQDRLLPNFGRLKAGPHNFPNRFIFAPGEYTNAFIDRLTGRMYEYEGFPRLLAPLHMWQVAGGAHHTAALDSTGGVWTWGDNSVGEIGDGTTTSRGNPVHITNDSLGNLLPAMIKVGCGGTTNWITYALAGDGRVFAWGVLTMGTRGNNTYGGQTNRPVQINFPAGVIIKDVIINELCIALDQNGQVWTWGAEGVGGGSWTPFILAQGTGSGYITRVPTPISLPSAAKQIAGGNEMTNYALLTNGQLYGWGFNLQYVGVSSGDLSSTGYNPKRVDNILNLPKAIDTLAINGMSTAAILIDSTLFAWGSNACGNMANGPGINYATYPSPYAWSQGNNPMQAPQITPVQIAPGMHNFTNLYSSLAFCFQWYASNGGDTTFAWGRNKYLIGNAFSGEIDSTAETIGSTWPNNNDENYIRINQPFNTFFTTRWTGRFCVNNPGNSLCSISPNQYDNSKARPTSNAGSNISTSAQTVTLKGSWTIASGVRGKNNRLWTVVSQPAGANALIPIRASDTSNVYNLTVNGVYTFKFWVEDANFKTDSTTMTVTISSSGFVPPTVNAGVDQNLTGVTATTLTGTASGNGGATITNLQWTQLSGPGCTVASPNTLVTGVTAMTTPGTYVFQLTATDSNGQQTSDNINVVVNTAPTTRPGTGIQNLRGHPIRWK